MSTSVARSRSLRVAASAEPLLRTACLVALAAVGACGGGDFPRPPGDAPVVRVASPGRVPAIAPGLSWSYYPAQAGQYVFEGLTRTEEDGTLVPALARTWEETADARTYRLRLRAGVTFHDGTPFTARDVVRAWSDLLREPVGELSHPWMLDGIEGVEAYSRGEAAEVSGLVIEDDSTLLVRLDEPLAFFPTLLSHAQAVIGGAGSRPDHPIGTGPWRFVSLDSTAIRFAANESYWNGRPRLDSLIYRHVPNALTAEVFEAGGVDVAAELPTATRVEWSTRADIGFVESEAVTTTRLVINMRDSLFHDVRIRRALNHSINAARLAEGTAAASVVRAVGSIPPSLPGADPQREPYAFDPTLARRLLREAGYPFERPLRLWVPAPGLSDFPAQIGPLLRDYLEAVGFDVALTVNTQGIDTSLAAGLADLTLTVWVGDYPDADAFLYPLYHSAVAGSAGNEGAYANPAVDRLIDATRREIGPRRRAELLRQADQLVFDEAPVVFLWFTRTATAYSLRLAGWGRDPQLSRFLDLRLATEPAN